MKNPVVAITTGFILFYAPGRLGAYYPLQLFWYLVEDLLSALLEAFDECFHAVCAVFFHAFSNMSIHVNHGRSETRATGMMFICDDGKQFEVAERIIRATMWQRKQLIGRSNSHERDRPVQYVIAPIRLKAQYEHVYLTTPVSLSESIGTICNEEDYIIKCQDGHEKTYDPAQGDYEAWPYRFFINSTTDLLKYVYFYAAAKSLLVFRMEHNSELNYAIVLPERDFPIRNMYPDVSEMDGLEVIKHNEC